MLIQAGPLPPAPRVTVVIAAYNLAAFVGAAIESVMAQTLPDWEAVVVDDGSTDRTWEEIGRLARPFGQVRALRQSNQGVSHARNAGLAAGDPRTPFVLFLDADDTLRPDGLELLVAGLEAQPDAVGVWGEAALIGPDGAPYVADWWPREPHAEGLYGFERVSNNMGIYPPSVCLFRRWAVEAVGGYDYFQRESEDLEFLSRVTLLGPMAYLSRIVTCYRRHPDNATSDRVRMEGGNPRLERKRQSACQAQAYLLRRSESLPGVRSPSPGSPEARLPLP